jgi:hypothetical protein
MPARSGARYTDYEDSRAPGKKDAGLLSKEKRNLARPTDSLCDQATLLVRVAEVVGAMSSAGDEETCQAFTWNGSNGAHSGPKADDAAHASQGN